MFTAGEFITQSVADDYSTDLGFIQRLLTLVTYRPGWTIEASRVPIGPEVYLQFHGPIIDADQSTWVDGEKTVIDVEVRAVVPPIGDADDFYDWLGWRLTRIERHESREFFQVSGTPWDSPHKTSQPKHDYSVRWWRPGSGWPGYWVVYRNADHCRVAEFDTWREAYADAWRRVVKDDLRKGDGFVNG